ncbi:hypothetical protein N7L96_09160 [Mammaliicoccus sciuri]|uniref:Uncharacterized protein n=1 Tax=Mammaliicoccus sciuri TaxID=1296 RepID=A0AAJ4SK73_MAMSC|nr:MULTISPECIES: hypothetical protein [Mammaliicoccus]EZX15013.1 hypothetical protein V070_02809 [Staphylococcus aureus C0673]MBF9297613.1 hypothetical protein [Staphylococcus schleiferi]MBN4912076.1 hypothetical protein [Staphylococcus sp. EG-SA-13]MCC2088860.1 hypothetical protein [Mammaliicoccus sciuri]MCD8837460.1 hypothetical protein [Mammaliicoccus sciuri]
MKKCLLIIAMVLMVLPFSTFAEANAATKNQLNINENNVQTYKDGTVTIEGIKIGDKISKIKSKYPNLMFSYSDDSNDRENYYEFDTKNGHMIITAKVKGNKETVKRVTMIYDKLTNVKLDSLVSILGDNTTKRVQNNKYTGGYAYVNNGQAHFQLSKATPDSKQFKVYRVDIGKY